MFYVLLSKYSTAIPQELTCCASVVLVISFGYLASPQGLFHSLKELEFNSLIARVAVLKLIFISASAQRY